MKTMTVCLQNLKDSSLTQMLFKSVIIAFYRESSQDFEELASTCHKPQKQLASLLYNFN